MDIPARVYPGQEVDATITVRDNWDSPVSKVDLTAFATTSLLEYHPDDLQYYGTLPSEREERSSYSIHKKDYFYNMPNN